MEFWRSIDESGSWWVLNIKLVIKLMAMGVGASKVSTLFIVCDLPNANTIKNSVPEIDRYIGCYIFQTPTKDMANELKIIYYLILTGSMRSGQRKLSRKIRKIRRKIHIIILTKKHLSPNVISFDWKFHMTWGGREYCQSTCKIHYLVMP